MGAPVLTLEHHGQPITVSLRGVVVDEFGISVPDATVTLSQGSLAIASTPSDRRGGFALPELEVKVAIHEVSARKAGYSSAYEELVLRKEVDNATIAMALRLNTEIHETRYSPEISKLERLEMRDPEPPSYATVKVFFATDRNQLIERVDRDPTKVFGTDRSSNSSMSFGQCDVSIPATHRIGNVERPSIWKLQFREDPEKHIVILAIEKSDENKFLRNVVLAARNSSKRDAFVFVHGYHVTFPEAIRRTAQIAFDLDFQGAPICYSWPSKGRFSGYAADEASVEWSTPHLCSFLTKLCSIEDIDTIHLIAHSMGNRAMVRCLEQWSNAGPRGMLQQVVLAAPDIDAGVFEELADRMVLPAKRTTLYASSNDLPLQMSRHFHAYRRAGESGDQILVLKNIDTVDASALPSDILGHSYYGDSRTVLSDVYDLFRNGTPPPRFGLRKAPSDKSFWIFVP